MTEPSNGDILRALGKLEGSLDAIKDSNSAASESRRVLYDKLDETKSVVQEIANAQKTDSFQLKVTTDLAVQTRDRFTAFHQKFEKEAAPILEGVENFRKEVQPLLDATRTVKNWAAFFAGVAGLGFISTASILAFFNAAVKAAFVAWLNSP